MMKSLNTFPETRGRRRNPFPGWMLLTMLCWWRADAATLNDWASRQTVSAPDAGLVRVTLSPETLDAAQASLADLRLLDPVGAEVPYVIERPRPTVRVSRPDADWKVFLEQNRTRIEVDVNPTGQLTVLALETPARDFLKPATLRGAKRGAAGAVEAPQVLASAYPVFRQPGGAEQLRFVLPKGAWVHLTVILDDAKTKPVPITGVVMQEVTTPTPVMEVAATKLGERIEGVGETRLSVDLGAARLPLMGLRFQTDEPLFIRRVTVLTRQWVNGEVRELPLGGGTIYRVALGGQTNVAQLDLALDTQPPTRELVLAIDNGDSPPLPVRAVEALTRPTYLLFLARQPGEHQLYSGHPRANPPRYDVALLASQFDRAKTTPARPGALGANPDYRPSEPLPEIPVFAAALDARPWGFRRAVKSAPGMVQQIELTPHVLAHAQPGLGDLRLVADGKQVQFIVERAGFTRALAPEATRADDPKKPQVSVWKLRLPQARLPVTQLSCETKAPLFQREARLLEDVRDGRGEMQTRLLGSASWVRRADGTSGRLRLALTGPPETENLRLEIDNGENAALELEKFQVSLPVVRVLFKAPPGATTELIYGNEKAVAPGYDLDLVAPRLLAAAKSDATLADADPAGPARSVMEANKAPFLFYGVLALVVIGLVVVIVRVLPKAEKAT